MNDQTLLNLIAKLHHSRHLNQARFAVSLICVSTSFTLGWRYGLFSALAFSFAMAAGYFLALAAMADVAESFE